MRNLALSLLAGVTFSGCAIIPQPQTELSTATEQIVTSDSQIDDRTEGMSLKYKISQLIMPDIGSISPTDVREYRFGSILNGGNSGPYGNDLGPAEDWLKLADEFWDASTAPLPEGEPIIPTLWATDAMHGHSNVIGATLFPHNVGLGATRDPDLIRRIGEVTAREIEVTGLDWTFAPTVAVARDDRWGRAYESYSEDPNLVAELGAAMVKGLQGEPGDRDYLGVGRVIATAKHFFGDGGTEQGVDQGDVNGPLEELAAIHVTPYPAAIEAGVEGIMASFNSINGLKMHGNGPLLDEFLRNDLRFEGVTVGDWNGHGQIAGCTNADCPQALLAGLDIYMVPEDWKALHASLMEQAQNGEIPIARIDEAVRRILRLKQKVGLFTEVKPSSRPNAGRWDLLGLAEHRALAREAVAKSMVILKNNGVLPLKEGANILVAGDAADNIAQQNGGWTLTWQGGGELTNDFFPNATSIYGGIEELAAANGGTAILSESGEYSETPDVAVVVFGEEPYAEFVGDRKNLILGDKQGLELLQQYEAEGIPTVAVFVTGRPLWMNRELNSASAFVAAWLPGGEGGGVADVLYGVKPATGRLSFSWPARCDGDPVNGSQGALFPFGYGRSLDDLTVTPTLHEECLALVESTGAEWFAAGRLADRVKALSKGTELPDLRGSAGGITARGVDRNTQEDAREINFGAGTALDLSGPQGGNAYRIAYQVWNKPEGSVVLASNGSTLDISQKLLVAEGKGWREMVLTQECLANLNNSLEIRSEAAFALQISNISFNQEVDGAQCSFGQ